MTRDEIVAALDRQESEGAAYWIAFDTQPAVKGHGHPAASFVYAGSPRSIPRLAGGE